MKLQKAMEQYEEWLQLPIKRLTRPVGCFKTQKYADTILFRTKQANERIEYDTIEQYKCDAYNKLGQLEDIEERLGKYKEIGINGLIDLFNKLTDDDIEYIVQLVFKKKGDIIMRLTEKIEENNYCGKAKNHIASRPLMNKLGQLEDIEDELGIELITLFKALKNGIYGKVGNDIEHILAPNFNWCNLEIYIWKLKDYGKTWALTKEELENARN